MNTVAVFRAGVRNMGILENILGLVFGNGRNVVSETAEVFRENAEAGAQRGADVQKAALAQFSQEFTNPQKGYFDRFMDGLNRIPRPAFAIGTLALFVSAMVDPLWFGARMQGLALVPEPLWWLLGAIMSFYFGARHQEKGQDFQRSIAQTMARAPQVIRNTRALQAMSSRGGDVPPDEDNPALRDWRANRSG